MYTPREKNYSSIFFLIFDTLSFLIIPFVCFVASRGIGVPTPPLQPPSNQVLCCAFNADGSIFVTGSSDKMARVRLSISKLQSLIQLVYNSTCCVCYFCNYLSDGIFRFLCTVESVSSSNLFNLWRAGLGCTQVE